MRTSLSSGMAFNHGANEVPKTSRSILTLPGAQLMPDWEFMTQCST